MLLAVDVGNTNVVAALFENDEIVHEWRIKTDRDRTGDEYLALLTILLKSDNFSTDKISDGVLSSVVPALVGPFISVFERIIGKKPVLVGPDIYPELPVTIPDSAYYEIGSDLVCNATAAYTLWKTACIIIDFGTALTFTTVDESGKIAGVAIAPGLKTAVKSLFDGTAQLPEVSLVAPKDSLGLNTIQSIQSGIVLGYKGLVEGLIARIKDDLSKKTGIAQDKIRVIATGGLNSVLKPITDVFQEVDKKLTLRGLKIIADTVRIKK